MKKLKAKNISGITDAPRQAQDLVSVLEANAPFMNRLRKSARENELYVTAENLSEKQKNDIYAQGRIPFPIPVVADKISKFIAAERNNRTSFKLLPKKMDAEVKCALGGLRLKDVETSSMGEYIESDIVGSGIGVKFGVGKIFAMKDKNLETVVRYKKIPYDRFGWDGNAITYEKDDAAFWYEERPTYRRNIRMDYGDKIADEIEIGTDFGDKKNQFWGVSDRDGRRDLDIINLIEYYERVIRTRYYLVFGGEVVHIANSKKDADEIMRMLKIPYLGLGQPIPQTDVIPIQEDGIDKYIFTYNEILEYEQTDYEYSPYVIYQAFQFEDEVWCMTDLLKNPAKFADKLMSQIDYAFGSDIKNGWEIVEPWLAQGTSMAEAIRRVKAGEPIPVIHSGAVRSIPSKGANPQWMEMYSLLNTLMGELSGGVWGGQQPPGKQREAQGTVQMKMMQGSAISGIFLDNKRRWKQNLGIKLVWFLNKYDTAKRVLRCHGGDLKPEMLQLLQQKKLYQDSPSMKNTGYVTLNDGDLAYLSDSEFDLAISMSETTEVMRQQKLGELRMMQEMGIQIPPSVLMEYADADYDVKQEIIQYNKEFQKQAAQDKEDEKNLRLIEATKGETDAGKVVGKEMAQKSLQTDKALNQPQPQMAE